MLRTPGAVLVLLVSVFCIQERLAAATNYVVNTNDSGPGSLREAMLTLNRSRGGTILFSNVNGRISLSTSLPPVAANISIYGPGANVLKISGGNICRPFAFRPGTTNIISGLTITEGHASTNVEGAAVFNAGTLTISRCTIISNLTERGTGGAIFNSGQLRVLETTISRNGVTYPYPPGDFPPPVCGGGLYVSNGGVTLVRSEFAQNWTTGATGRHEGGYGRAGLGGAVFVANGDVTFLNCVLVQNTASGGQGGGAYVVSFGGNGGPGYGGAIASLGGTVRLINCVLASNVVSGGSGGSARGAGGTGEYAAGGGIFAKAGTLLLTNCSLAGNFARSGAGGFATRGTSGDSGTATGGAITVADTSASVVNCGIFGNTAKGAGGTGAGSSSTLAGAGGSAQGGAIFVETNSTVICANSTVSQNISEGGAGGAHGGSTMNFASSGTAQAGALFIRLGSRVDLSSCTIASNRAIAALRGGSAGGGLFSAGASVGIHNSLFAGNSAMSDPDVSGTVLNQGYNIFGQAVGATLGPLQDNGGPTFTHALLAGSPAIDAGFGDRLATDQRGEPRTVDNPLRPNGVGGDGTDIGALEVDHRLRMTRSRRDGADMVVRFTSVSDKVYGLRYKSQITDVDWISLPLQIRGTGGIVSARDIGNASHRFYRAFEMPP